MALPVGTVAIIKSYSFNSDRIIELKFDGFGSNAKEDTYQWVLFYGGYKNNLTFFSQTGSVKRLNIDKYSHAVTGGDIKEDWYVLLDEAGLKITVVVGEYATRSIFALAR